VNTPDTVLLYHLQTCYKKIASIEASHCMLSFCIILQTCYKKISICIILQTCYKNIASIDASHGMLSFCNHLALQTCYKSIPETPTHPITCCYHCLPDPEIPDLKMRMRARNAVLRPERTIGIRDFGVWSLLSL
jgi:hypothetical protein